MTAPKQSLSAKIRTRLREKGLLGVARSAFRRFVYKHTVSIHLEHDLTLPKKLRSRQGVEIEHITEIDEARFQKHFAKHVDAYRRLLAQGCIAFGASHEGDVIGVGWWAMNDYFDSDVYQCTFPVEDGQAYQFAGELAPEYRGTSISLMILIAAWNHLIDIGCTRVYAISDIKNVTSLKWHRHLDFKPNGLALDTRRVLAGTWSRTRPLHPREREDWERKTARKRKPRAQSGKE